MTKKESDLLRSLQKNFSDMIKHSKIKHDYFVSLKTSDPEYNLILVPADEESVDPVEYTIYLTSDSNRDEDEMYYCTTWEEVIDVANYMFSHPELFNPENQIDSSDVMSYPDYSFTVRDIDEYLDNNYDYDISSLYDEYKIK